MTSQNSKPAINIFYSIGLANPTNLQAFQELRDELRCAGYPTELELSPPSGQFSASLEQILIVIGSGGSVGTAVFAKKYLEHAADSAWAATARTLRKLVKRKPADAITRVSVEAEAAKGQSVNVVITIDADGKQIKNVLAKGPDDIKEFPTRPDRPHGHIIEPSDDAGLIIKRSDGSGAQHWTPPHRTRQACGL
jgi:hypothetical protein